jgi:response regulator RpfG family c-di-GMP phosphodiesterase
MDTIFFLGDSKDQIPTFLGRLGYAVLGLNPEQPIADVVAQTPPDIILIDGRVAHDTINLFEFFRAQESTRGVPIICVSPDQEHDGDQLVQFERVEIVPATSSVGMLASRIATQLRLRKTAGADVAQSSLAEMNLALRDYNTRMKKDLEEAREIQRSLLPQKLPRDPRFQLAVSYHPLEEVGGDWYSEIFTMIELLSSCISPTYPVTGSQRHFSPVWQSLPWSPRRVWGRTSCLRR